MRNASHQFNVWLLAVLLMLAFVLPVTAQDDDSEAREIIANAYAQLADARYSYTLTMDSGNVIVDSEGERFGVQQTYEIEGEAVGADFADTMTLTVTPLENEDDVQTGQLARVRVGDRFYVRPGTLLAQQLGVADAWWLMQDLLDEIGGDSVQSFAAQQLEGIPTPLATALDDALIRSVTELEPGDINGVAVRVFEVEMKAVEMATAAFEGTIAERVNTFLEALPLMLQSELSIVYRLYIGADDGQLYRSESEAFIYLPFIEYGGSSDPDYDIENTGIVTIDIDYTDAPETIDAPTP